ncbi:MAG TPA: ABC-type transport auxiliary lipoprotein family protein [Kofleriaceae bacterium]
MTRALAAFLAVVAGCALAARSEPRELRSFAPELASPASFAGPTCARIRLGRVVAGPSLRLAIQRRVSPVELQTYETLRWTESPDTYVRRAVVQALFARPLAQAVTGPAHVLDVEVVAFEEVVNPTGRAGRVMLRYELRSTQQVVARGEAAVVRPASATAIDAVVAAIGDALTAASGQLADEVVAAACAIKAQQDLATD